MVVRPLICGETLRCLELTLLCKRITEITGPVMDIVLMCYS
jgi:hypothetical protein